MSELEVRRLQDDRDVQALSPILGWAFGFPAEECPVWFEKTGRDNVRVALKGARVVGGLVHLPMGQYFGGRSVPMVGIAGVAVAPEARGRGVALGMMQNSLRELAQANVALSSLYPATQALYRAAGYEQAGTRFEYRLEPAKLVSLGRDVELAKLDDADERIERTYRAHAVRCAGWLDRGKYIWDRVRGSRESKAQAYGAIVDGELEGYLYIAQKRTRGARYDLVLTDAVALTPRAGRRLLSFVSDHGTLADSAVWFGGPADSLLALLPEQSYALRLVDQWMLRIVNVAAALEARGFPAELAAELAIELDDPIVPENSGRWLLEIARGRCSVRRGGDGALKLGARGLAALYAGYLDPHALCRADLAAGSEQVLATAGLAFSGPSPCMPDTF